MPTMPKVAHYRNWQRKTATCVTKSRRSGSLPRRDAHRNRQPKSATCATSPTCGRLQPATGFSPFPPAAPHRTRRSKIPACATNWFRFAKTPATLIRSGAKPPHNRKWGRLQPATGFSPSPPAAPHRIRRSKIPACAPNWFRFAKPARSVIRESVKSAQDAVASSARPENMLPSHSPVCELVIETCR